MLQFLVLAVHVRIMGVAPTPHPRFSVFSRSGTTTTDLVHLQATSVSISSRLTAYKTAELSTPRSATRSLSVARTHVSLQSISTCILNIKYDMIREPER